MLCGEVLVPVATLSLSNRQKSGFFADGSHLSLCSSLPTTTNQGEGLKHEPTPTVRFYFHCGPYVEKSQRFERDYFWQRSFEMLYSLKRRQKEK